MHPNKKPQPRSKNKEEILQQIYAQLAKTISAKISTLDNIHLSSIQYVDDLHLPKILVETETNEDFGALVQIHYDIYYDTINIQGFLLQNWTPFCLNGQYEKIIALRMVEKLNKFLEVYERRDQKINALCFCLNPISGMPSLNCKLFLDKLIKDSALFLRETQTGIAEFIAQILVLLFDFKLILNFVTHQETFPSQAKLLKYALHKKNFNSIKVVNEHLSEVANFMDVQLQSNYDHVVNEELTKSYFLSNFFQFNPDIQKIFDFFNLEVQNFHNTPIHTILEQIFDYSCSFLEDEPEKTILEEIKILTEPQYICWEPIARGGFGLIEKAELSYQLYERDEEGKAYTSKRRGMIVKKSDCTKRKKIPREKEILGLMEKCCHPNIMTHYYCDSPMYENYLFSKYQPEQSLDQYLEANRKTISLKTIINFLAQISNGLYFLKEKKIVHLDLKPSNVIVSKNLKAKIADFGEAFWLEEDPYLHRQNHAFTMPYCPPQIFDKEVVFSPKNDIYSFGVTMYKCIFGEHVFGERLELKKFVGRLKRREVEIYLSPERFERMGLKKLLRELTRLSLRCMEREGQDRPSNFYILILFRIYQHYLSILVQ